MCLIIVSATEKELAAALRDVPEFDGAAPAAGTIRQATILGRDVCLLTTGVGPINAALAAGRVMATRPDIQGVVLVGVAGTFDAARAPVGSLTVASSEVFPEYGLRTPDGVDPRGIGFPQCANGEAGEVWDEIGLNPEHAATRMGLHLPECTAGPSLTVSGVTNCGRTLSDFETRYAPLTENMEGFPWALAAARTNLPFLEIRSVSNKVGNRTDWNLQAALDTLASSVPGLLRPGRELAKGR